MNLLTVSVLVIQAAASASSVSHTVFVVDKVSQVQRSTVYGNRANAEDGEHHTAPVVMAEFSKKCPAVTFTKNKDSADFLLETQPGGSSLSNQKGDVLFVSPAKTLKNMTKDVCGYITAH